MDIFTYIQRVIGQLCGTCDPCNVLFWTNKQTQIRYPGLDGIHPWPMPSVTKDPWVRYLSGMGLVLLVTNYIKILISHMYHCYSSRDECHWSQANEITWSGLKARPPFGVLERGNGAMAPEKFVTIFWTFIKLSVYCMCNDRLNSMLGTIRGDGITHICKSVCMGFHPPAFYILIKTNNIYSFAL